MPTRNVTTIPATMAKFTNVPLVSMKKRRVAGYARVSTDHEEQQSSYEAQVDYYTQYIKSREDWDFVKIYTDEGISATNTKHREGFNSMIKDALDGKIDLIITKSVSRFARNTVDSLTTVRKLKDKGIEIYFEKENIWTLDSKGELLISIMSSLAQEESRSISENTTWGQRKRFADGKATVPFKRFLGYDRGEDGSLIVNPEQAKTVQLIYRLFLTGLSFMGIAKELMKRGIKSPGGKDKWNPSVIQSILTNEKMKGDALLQKKFTVDFLTKKMVKNEGQIPQYYVTGSHEAIIDPATFDIVQTEIARRKSIGKRYSGMTIFSNRIKCGECGSFFGAKVWHSNDKYRKVIYRCNKKYDGHKCQTPHVTEEEIKLGFIVAFNQLCEGKEILLENLRLVQREVCDTTTLEAEERKLADEMKVLVDMVQACIGENARVAQNQADYQSRYNELVSRYDAVKEKYDATMEAVDAKRIKAETLDAFAKTLRSRDAALTEFDEGLWGTLVDCMIVYGKGDVGVTFRDGTEIRIR